MDDQENGDNEVFINQKNLVNHLILQIKEISEKVDDIKKVNENVLLLTTKVQELTSLLNEQKHEITKVRTDNELLKKSNDELIQKNKANEDRLGKVEAELESHEMYSRRNSVRITLPERQDMDNTDEDTNDIVIGLARSMKVDIRSCDLDRSHKIPNKKNNPPKPATTIIAKFISHDDKVRFLRGKKHLKKDSGIFVNEDLTSFRAHILAEARKLKKDKLIFKCFSVDGKITVQENNAWGNDGGGKFVTIRSKDDLLKYTTRQEQE